jgi:hypothetical protein
MPFVLRLDSHDWPRLAAISAACLDHFDDLLKMLVLDFAFELLQ